MAKNLIKGDTLKVWTPTSQEVVFDLALSEVNVGDKFCLSFDNGAGDGLEMLQYTPGAFVIMDSNNTVISTEEVTVNSLDEVKTIFTITKKTSNPKLVKLAWEFITDMGEISHLMLSLGTDFPEWENWKEPTYNYTLYKSGKEVPYIYKGNDVVSAIYKGEQLIWKGEKKKGYKITTNMGNVVYLQVNDDKDIGYNSDGENVFQLLHEALPRKFTVRFSIDTSEGFVSGAITEVGELEGGLDIADIPYLIDSPRFTPKSNTPLLTYKWIELVGNRIQPWSAIHQTMGFVDNNYSDYYLAQGPADKNDPVFPMYITGSLTYKKLSDDAFNTLVNDMINGGGYLIFEKIG